MLPLVMSLLQWVVEGVLIVHKRGDVSPVVAPTWVSCLDVVKGGGGEAQHGCAASA